jgi:N-acetylglucosaminyl-diphospho-decaprenol L-rhamnosyltransferase
LKSLSSERQGIHIEVIVVDNASTDDSAEMIKTEFPDVILIQNEKNLGFAQASNQAARIAKGEYLFFLNNDTVVPDQALRKLVEYAGRNPGFGMIGPKLVDPSGRLQISYRRKPTLLAMLHRTILFRFTGILRASYNEYRREGFEPTQTRQVEVLMGAAVLLQRDVFDAAGEWDEDFPFGGEDIELSARIAKQKPLYYVPTVSVLHHGRVGSRMNVNYALTNTEIGYIRFFRKDGASKKSIFCYKLAMTLDLPVQLANKSIQWTYRSLIGSKRKAEKSARVVRGIWNFATRDLVRFWKS